MGKGRKYRSNRHCDHGVKTGYNLLLPCRNRKGANTFRGLNWSKTATVTTAAADTKKTADTITAISAEMKISGGTPLTLKAEEKDGKMYLMLPSSADLTALTLHLEASEELKNVMVFGCKGENIFDGKDTTVNVLKLNGAISSGQSKLYLSLNGEEPIELLLMQSANLASMYLTSDDPQTQGRDYVDAAKSHAVTAQMQMLSADGTVIYEGELKQLKARGNSTFTYYPKKSYQIKLGTESDLLGTHEQVKTWVLLAGYADATQMRDKLFKDLAAGMGMAYTASCDWVDLYYDGEYRGTYLLSEKNAVGATSIPITDMEKDYEAANTGYGENAEVKEDVNKYEQKIVYTDGLTDPGNITGGYLIERNLETIDEANGFYTRTGSGFNVKSPEFLSKEAMSYISEYYQEFEDAVYAVDEEGNYTGEGEYDENGNIRLDENGEPVEISKGGFSYGDGPTIEIYAMTQEQMLACSHGDIRHGFVLEFNEHQPDIDIPTLEARVNELIRQDLPIDYYDESHILIGGVQHYCTGPRTHVRSTGRIIGFRLLDHFIYDHFHKTYMLVGCVGDDSEENIRKLEKIHG